MVGHNTYEIWGGLKLLKGTFLGKNLCTHNVQRMYRSLPVVRAIPSSDGNSRTPPEIHEGPPNLAESNEKVQVSKSNFSVSDDSWNSIIWMMSQKDSIS
jgi:hypothetical protein